ncbi:MAG: IS66 family insertion sequence element accessory protein TnpB [Ruminococcus flavefaciens]|nr:IS66 family insertion sequence element accessory protein TnpB [Ruminococcus flavefaciens]
MPAKPVKAKEQYRLVMECRSSGLTDHQWCMEKGICPGTFYGWVRRLRQKGYQDIPEPIHSQRACTKQEIVRIGPDIPALPDVAPSFWETVQPVFPAPIMELSIAGAVLRIPNGTNPALLREAVRLIGGGSC